LWSSVASAYRSTGQAQTVEGLWRRDLVEQVEVDVEEVRLSWCAPDDVLVPYLLAQGPTHDLS
jgi:hypothetical protein